MVAHFILHTIVVPILFSVFKSLCADITYVRVRF